MSRRRKPVSKPIGTAVEELYWYTRQLAEECAGLELPIQLFGPLKRVRMALDNFDASRGPVVQGRLELTS